MVGHKKKEVIMMHTSSDLAHSGASTTIQKLLTVIGAAGIPAIFLPFAYDTSPFVAAFGADTFLSDLWRVSWPFFLPVLITTALVRWIFMKKHSQTEIIAGYIVGAGILCITFSGYVRSFEWDNDPEWQIAFISPFVILLFGIFVLLKNRKQLIPRPSGAIVVMQVAYLANCSLCLISFNDSWQIAAYLSLATAIAYLAQIILLPVDDKPVKHVNAS